MEDPPDEQEVEEVRDKRKVKDDMQYLVKWVGWPSEYNSYEPAVHLANAPDAIRAYERKLKRKRPKDDDGDDDDSLMAIPDLEDP